jgi:ATP-dependent metalloprotease FtsH
LSSNWKNILLYAVIILAGILLLLPLFNVPVGPKEISFSDFLNQVDQGKVAEVTIRGEVVEGKFSDKKLFTTRAINYPQLVPLLREKNVNFKVEPPADSAWFWNLFWQILAPIAVFGLLWFLLMRQAQSANSQAMAFGRSRVKPLMGKVNVTFKDVAGVDEAKEELQEIVEFLKTPEKFQNLGARIPKGLLLVGAPGTGKTLLARAIAGEAGVPFFSLSGSDFIEMFVGVGASVTPDTKVLIRDDQATRLMPIGEFVDQFYAKDESGCVKYVNGFQTLGYEGKNGNKYTSEKKYFGKSKWQELSGVYRHRAEEIYEINYLGGVIKTTADHSIFVRDGNRLVVKKAAELKVGEKLVNLPFKVRGRFLAGLGTLYYLRAHEFGSQVDIELEFWDRLAPEFNKYAFAMAQQEENCQQEIAQICEVSRSTVGNWQKEKHLSRYLANVAAHPDLPDRVRVTPELMKLFGYYTAEGRDCNGLEFCFGSHEKDLHVDVIRLMRRLFNMDPVLEETSDNSTKIIYHVAPLGDFFAKHCGTGSHHKHVPDFIWELPCLYFEQYLEGYAQGDGYTTKEGKLSITSVSKQLIDEIVWLCAMHGIKAGVKAGENKEGRRIKEKNHPLPAGKYWSVVIGKTSHPFIFDNSCQIKRPVIKKIIKKPYAGYVYDLCGCDNEAFFGGDKPVLLHNSRVRDLFSQARKAAPSIIFMDEIDAVVRHLGAGLGGGHDEREQTLNQLLVEMDGFDPKTNVIVVAATNRPDILDPALLRPGRFDRQVVLDKPDIKGRRGILDIHAQGKPLSSDVNLEIVARRTPGFTGADLENVMNEAAILAARADKKEISMAEVEEAIDRVLAGPQKKNRVISEHEKKVVAYHEVGHALLSHLLPKTDPVHKISILPRGMALGYTLQLPEQDKHLVSRAEALDQITVMLGGRVAEEMMFGESEITSGAQNDLQRATELAKQMVCEYGMSSLGTRTFGRKDRQIFLGRDIAELKDYGEKTADAIDTEIEKLIDECHARAREILGKNKDHLVKLADTLIEKESLEGDELAALLEKIK